MRRGSVRSTMAMIALTSVALMVAGAVALAAGGREGPITVKVGSLEVTADGGFTPKALWRDKQTPIAIQAQGSVREEDGGHPPAIREFRLETDKYGELHVKGIPTCRMSQILATTTAEALKACGPALVGKGKATAQVAFPEQKPIDVRSKLLLFNGGERGGKTTWFGHVYFSYPVSGAIVGTVTIERHPHGRFGDLVIGKIPRIAAGYGSGLSFKLDIFKDVGGINPISARCADGKLRVHIEGHFEDGTEAGTELIRACTAKG